MPLVQIGTQAKRRFRASSRDGESSGTLQQRHYGSGHIVLVRVMWRVDREVKEEKKYCNKRTGATNRQLPDAPPDPCVFVRYVIACPSPHIFS